MPYFAGLARLDITPPLPFPLGGVVVRGGRTATSVRDPLYARALVVSDGERRVALLSADLLVFHRELTKAVHARLGEAGVAFDALLLAATHTHSAPGGYWDTPTAEAFMGPYRPDLFERLADGVAGALVAAARDLRPARLSLGQSDGAGLSWNRRHPQGALDRLVSLLLVDRDDGRHRVVMFGAHPVIGSERASLVATADFPGAVMAGLEADGSHAQFVNGPVAGVNVVFPEPISDLDAHLALVRDAMLARVRAAEASARPLPDTGVAGVTRWRALHAVTPRIFPSRWAALDVAALPLRLWVRRFLARGVGASANAPVTVLRLGDALLAGFPADLDPAIGLAAREQATAAGLTLAVAASHCNDYVGYVHAPETYELPPTRGETYTELTLYENAMAAFGRGVGTAFGEAFGEALQALRG